VSVDLDVVRKDLLAAGGEVREASTAHADGLAPSFSRRLRWVRPETS